MQEDDLDPVWRGLANPIRRAILDRLKPGPRTTGELAAAFPELSRFAIMQHLKVLEAGHLVLRRRQGRHVLNHLNPVPIQEIYHRWVMSYQQPWAEALVAMKEELEEEQRAIRKKSSRRSGGRGA